MISKTLAAARAFLSLMIFASSFGVFQHATVSATAQRKATVQRKATARQTKAEAVVYACPMHAEVTSKRAKDRCPKCGMNLRAVTADEQSKVAVTDNAGPVDAANDAKRDENAPLSIRVPDTTVYDQNGRQLDFYNDLVKGKTVAIQFIFTTCNGVCPPLAATFRRVQQDLGERVGRDIELISISVDPATDVPERLKAFSEKFKAGPGWTFVTGSKPGIDKLLTALGGYVSNKTDHTPLVLVGNDAANFWTRTYGLAPPSQIVKIINEAAVKKGAASVDGSRKQSPPDNASPSDAAAKYFPDTVLLTQDNKPVRFYSDLLKGKVVLINFLFTTCKGVCPPMTANLAKVQKYLGERVGRDVLLLSISVDPETDKPDVLKKYADSFKAQPGWYFLTGEKKNVDWVLYKLGGYVEEKEKHSSVLIVGNEATGEWMKVHAMSNPTEIASAVTKLFEPK